MKVSLNTLGCPGWGLDKVIHTAYKFGIQGIEIRGLGGKISHEDIPELSAENSGKFCKCLGDAGIHAVCLGTSAAFHDKNKTDIAYNEAVSAIICAYRCKIDSIRVFGNNIESPMYADNTINHVANQIRRLCDFSEEYFVSHVAGDRPVKVLLEAHGDFNTPDIISKTANIIHSPVFGIIWDVAHTHRALGDNILSFWKEMRPLIHHLHIKDHIRTENGYTLCPVGQGDIPLREIISAVNSDGFDGYLSLETEKAWHPELPNADVECANFIHLIASIDQ